MRGWGVRNDELAMRAAFIKNTMLGEAPSVMMTARRRLVLFLLNRNAHATRQSPTNRKERSGTDAQRTSLQPRRQCLPYPTCFILTTSHETIYPHEDPYLISHSTFLAIKQVAGWVALRHWCFVTYIQQPTNLSQKTGKAQQRYVTNLSHKRVNTWFCDVCRGG